MWEHRKGAEKWSLLGLVFSFWSASLICPLDEASLPFQKKHPVFAFWLRAKTISSFFWQQSLKRVLNGTDKRALLFLFLLLQTTVMNSVQGSEDFFGWLLTIAPQNFLKSSKQVDSSFFHSPPFSFLTPGAKGLSYLHVSASWRH